MILKNSSCNISKLILFFNFCLENENEVLGWLLHQMKHEEIESVNDEMLEMLIAEHKFVSALFYDDMERMSTRILTELENIDDEAENNTDFKYPGCCKHLFLTPGPRCLREGPRQPRTAPKTQNMPGEESMTNLSWP